MTVLAYVPAIGGTFIWDDDSYVTRNMTLRTGEGLRRIWTELGASPQYYPLTLSTFWVEYHIWGLSAGGYHAVNVLLHAGSAVLLWLMLRRLGVKGAWLAAAIFAVHPVHVESVEWITERKNVLSGFLYLLAAIAYLNFEGAWERGNAAERWWWYLAAVVLFAAALLSKTVTSTLPAALLLVIWWKRGRVRSVEVARLLPLLVMGVGLGLMTAWIERHNVGARGQDFDLGWVRRVLLAGRIIWFYAAKLVWPVNLCFIYPRWEVDAGVWWQWLYPLGVVGVIAALWVMRERFGRGPLAAFLFFAGTLFPALGFVNVYPMRFSYVADHFQYLASIGFIVLIAACLVRVGGLIGRNGAAAGSVIILVMLSVLTWRQAEAYAMPESLWRTTVRRNPRAWMAHTNLGVLLLDRAEAATRAGDSAGARRDFAEAEEEFRETGRLVSWHLEPWMNLGRVAELRGDYAAAEWWLKKAMRVNPREGEPHFHLGRVLAEQGKAEAAIAEYRTAIELNPEREPTYVNLGLLLADQGKPAEAIACYQSALRVQPDSIRARTALGFALMQTGKFAGAAAEFRRALALDPNFAAAREGLAEAGKAAGGGR